jgi:hypothetical protein
LYDKALFQRHQASITILLLSVYFSINGFVNATTVLMEAMRSPPFPFEPWEPFVWEYSSAIGSFVVVLWLSRFLLLFPWSWQRPILSAGIYSLMALVFSFAHIAFMIFSREIVYFLMGRDYEFAVGLEQWIFELLYELRKDIWSFAFFVILIWGYRYIVAQWLGDAKDIKVENKVSDSIEDTVRENDLLLVKKLGREFLVNKNEVEWVESSGNYLNLHLGGNIFPMRGTFSSFLEKNTHIPIKRVHRSYAVNLNYVSNLTLTTSGDGTIELTSGQKVKMSRRYKLQFE